MNCPICHKHKATIHPTYGILPCLPCKKKQNKNPLPNIQVELTTESIKEQRKEYAKSILQPYRGGQLSKEYLDIYGTKNIKPTTKEVKDAKYVWRDTFSSNMDLHKSK